MQIRFKLIFIILLVISGLCMLAPFAAALVSTIASYGGICYGFTDGQWNCPWWEYGSLQLFWAGVLSYTPALLLIATWITALGFWTNTRTQPAPHTLPLWKAVLIPVIGFFGGVLFLFVIPVLLSSLNEIIP